jgi:IS30 family transposase
MGQETVLFGVVEHFLREGWSPEQIAGTMKCLYPQQPEQRVSHETIYNALYVMPKGELRSDLLACLRQGPTGSAASSPRRGSAGPDSGHDLRARTPA